MRTIKTSKGVFTLIQIPDNSINFELKEFDRFGDSLFIDGKIYFKGAIPLGYKIIGTSNNVDNLIQLLDEKKIYFENKDVIVFDNYQEVGKSFFMKPEDSFESLIKNQQIKNPILILKSNL